jgi:hypothetical protein
MTPDDLERAVGAALRALPSPRAPRTLLPRVLAVTSGAASWPARGWRAWPESLQAAAAIAAVCTVAAAAAIASGLLPIDTLFAAAGFDVPAWLAWTRDALGATTAVARTIQRLLLEPAITATLALTLTVALAIALFRSALSRLALGGASPS